MPCFLTYNVVLADTHEVLCHYFLSFFTSRSACRIYLGKCNFSLNSPGFAYASGLMEQINTLRFTDASLKFKFEMFSVYLVVMRKEKRNTDSRIWVPDKTPFGCMNYLYLEF